MGDQQFVKTADPGEALSALSNETRVDILLALWGFEANEATFSRLREAVGMRDSGQFNYHLDKLTDEFVRKTDDGYELTVAGMQVVGAVESGSVTMDGRLDPVELDDPCPSCGGARTLHYENEMVQIECADCEMSAEGPVPPGALVDYDPADIPDVTSRYLRTMLEKGDTGFCPYCDGHVEPSISSITADVDDTESVPERLVDLPFVTYTCQRCDAPVSTDLGMALLNEPAVVSFYYDNGVDVRDASLWQFATWDTDSAWIESEDPFRAVATYEADSATLRLVVDDERTVLETERSDE